MSGREGGRRGGGRGRMSDGIISSSVVPIQDP